MVATSSAATKLVTTAVGVDRTVAEFGKTASAFTAMADKLQRWTRELLLTRDARELPTVAVRAITEHFLVPQVTIRVWDVAAEFADEPFAQGVSDDVKAFADSLMRPYCGGNPGLQRQNRTERRG